jgi:NAD(P)-dependent dehydrogenase (short-subunit alcohol dehydrogenase family)
MPDSTERRGARGRTAFVTGGARGIGLAYVERLLADGANVVAVDLHDPTPAIADLQGPGERLGLVGDISSDADVDAMVRTVLDRFGRIDILVNNAGIFPATDLPSITLATWRSVQAVNVEPVLRFSQAFAPGMREHGWGRIVNTGSANTLLGGKDIAYLPSKSAVHGLTRALANELGEFGITVNAIAPSVVATDGFLGRDREAASADQILSRVMAMQSIRRRSVPSDVADALGFLVSDAAAFITGQILHVDGGLTRTGA